MLTTETVPECSSSGGRRWECELCGREEGRVVCVLLDDPPKTRQDPDKKNQFDLKSRVSDVLG